MIARSLDGRLIAAQIKAELAGRVSALREHGVVPGLGTLLVGDDPASRSYVAGKHRDCAEVGVRSIAIELPADASQHKVAEAVHQLNEDPTVTGFIVQLPLPAHIDQNAILELIDPAKDADGLHPVNLGRLVLGVDPAVAIHAPLPCTPAGIVELLHRYDLSLAGMHVVVLGRGITVGRPLGLLLSRKGIDATVTLAHSRTQNISAELARADVVVAAIGVPHFVEPNWVKPGAIVLDVGITRLEGSAQLAGDVHPDVAGVTAWLSPNPGGVGPMTRVMLVSNIVSAAETSITASARGNHVPTV